MNITIPPLVSPLARYRDIIASLCAGQASPEDHLWMRFAAQAAVLCPETSDQLAWRIRHIAEILHKRTSWFAHLSPSARFLVAALLIQHHVPVGTFHAEHDRTQDMFRDVGLPHGGFTSTIAVLILHISSSHQPISLLEAERLKAIYNRMKSLHWWLTGPGDVPICAALAQCPGSAEELVGRADQLYRQLHAHDLGTGSSLHTVAHLLLVTGLPPDSAITRLRSLARCLSDRQGVLHDGDLQALVVLTMLDHPTTMTITRLIGVRGELDLLQPQYRGMANLIIAADLAFLDLIRSVEDAPDAPNARQAQEMLSRIHAFHITTAVLATQVDAHRLMQPTADASGGWPVPYGW